MIPHGHYTAWFAARQDLRPTAGRVVFFGTLRPVKGVDRLLEAFRSVTAPGAELRIVGRPQVPEVADVVRAEARRDPRVRVRLEHVDDGDLAEEIRTAQLVVLPYLRMVNSGAVLLALSLGRPILVPDTETNRELRREVGSSWVHLYRGDVTADAIERALATPGTSRDDPSSGTGIGRASSAGTCSATPARSRRLDRREPSRADRRGAPAAVRAGRGVLRLGGAAPQNAGAPSGLRPATTIVVDNVRSPRDSAAIADLTDELGWQLVTPGRNLGFGAGANAGIAAAVEAGCDVIAIVNPDVHVDEQTLRELEIAARDDPNALIGPRLLRPDGTVWFDGGWLDCGAGRVMSRDASGPDGQPWLTGACVVGSADLWTRLKGFDEDYFLYWEDVDLSHRCLRAGGSIVVRQDLSVVHEVGGTQASAGRREKSALYYRYNCRNRLVFAAKHLPRRMQLRWLLSCAGDARAVVLRGGRRQLLRPWRNVVPAIAGCAAGFFWLVRSARSDPSLGDGRSRGRRLRHPVVRYYQTLRSAHLERAHRTGGASVVFVERRADFDVTLTAGLDLVRLRSPFAALRLMIASGAHTVEINEPLMLPGQRRTLVVAGGLRAWSRLTGRRVRIVSYAIENRNPFAAPVRGLRTRTRRAVQRVACRTIARSVDRLAFGTSAAQELYRATLGRQLRSARLRLVPAIPAACDCPAGSRLVGRVLFVGALERRKGLPQLLDAWPTVTRLNPEATLTLVGTGESSRAESLAGSDANVRLVKGPTRAEIHAAYRAASVVVLLSQPAEHWREQIGLPIVEGLAHGCRVVASTETGLASWLVEHGHVVLAPDVDAERLGRAILGALDAGRSTTDATPLPSRDGRLVADDWLVSAS